MRRSRSDRRAFAWARSENWRREGEMFRFLRQKKWGRRSQAENHWALPEGDGREREVLKPGILGLRQQSRWQGNRCRIPAGEPHPSGSPARSFGNSHGWPAFSCCRIRPSSAGSKRAPRRSFVTQAMHKPSLAQAVTTTPTMPLRFEGPCAFIHRISAELRERQISVPDSLGRRPRFSFRAAPELSAKRKLACKRTA
jgi:hypothetical protein